MTNATQTRAKRASKPKPDPESATPVPVLGVERDPEPVVEPVVLEPAEPEQASYLDPDDDLAAETDGKEIPRLPVSGKRVFVRYLEGPEVSAMRFLPALSGFQQVQIKLIVEELRVRKLREDAKDQDAGEDDDGEPIDAERAALDEAEAEAETMLYMAHVAHMAVRPPDGGSEAQEKCEDCGMKHRPAFLTTRVARRLKPADLKAISDVALRVDQVEAALPFSQDETPPDSPEPVESSIVTPPTN